MKVVESYQYDCPQHLVKIERAIYSNGMIDRIDHEYYESEENYLKSGRLKAIMTYIDNKMEGIQMYDNDLYEYSTPDTAKDVSLLALPSGEQIDRKSSLLALPSGEQIDRKSSLLALPSGEQIDRKSSHQCSTSPEGSRDSSITYYVCNKNKKDDIEKELGHKYMIEFYNVDGSLYGATIDTPLTYYIHYNEELRGNVITFDEKIYRMYFHKNCLLNGVAIHHNHLGLLLTEETYEERYIDGNVETRMYSLPA